MKHQHSRILNLSDRLIGVLLACLLVVSCAPIEENVEDQASSERDRTSIEMKPASLNQHPYQTAFLEDALLSEGFILETAGEDPPTYLLLTGWEDGWEYSHYVAGTWKMVGNSEQRFSNVFEIVDFDNDGDVDLVLFELREDNLFGVELPVQPRLFDQRADNFREVSLGCSPDLLERFSIEMEAYLQKDERTSGQQAVQFKKEIMDAEKRRLLEKCE